MAAIDKSSMRTQALAAREALAEDVRVAAGRAAAKYALKAVPENARIIAGYRAVRGEIDIFPALELLAARGHIICLPVVGREAPEVRGQMSDAEKESVLTSDIGHPASAAKQLIFRRWRPGDLLEVGAYGIEIPPESEPTLVPDTVIVPLVAFDAKGHRLGYGAGYYDRTIADLRRNEKGVRIFGAGYSMQQVAHIPAEGHDQRLDMVVTEKGILSMQSTA